MADVKILQAYLLDEVGANTTLWTKIVAVGQKLSLFIKFFFKLFSFREILNISDIHLCVYVTVCDDVCVCVMEVMCVILQQFCKYSQTNKFSSSRNCNKILDLLGTCLRKLSNAYFQMLRNLIMLLYIIADIWENSKLFSWRRKNLQYFISE